MMRLILITIFFLFISQACTVLNSVQTPTVLQKGQIYLEGNNDSSFWIEGTGSQLLLPSIGLGYGLTENIEFNTKISPANLGIGPKIQLTKGKHPSTAMFHFNYGKVFFNNYSESENPVYFRPLNKSSIAYSIYSGYSIGFDDNFIAASLTYQFDYLKNGDYEWVKANEIQFSNWIPALQVGHIEHLGKDYQIASVTITRQFFSLFVVDEPNNPKNLKMEWIIILQLGYRLTF